ncbi:hypothetical protein N7537_005342 [Penicillium hordei]|uniref:Uncharacterized protein n=1 Tax=Penicillium hordei TaxID=40994 RepID=A0AAD6E5X9_9EURO|nr:uncharacterized protein N7537_005342 [Penicillium hordei]KAJ5602386.1 hypothetical protein N7537_005342 [Penicillium hordei]
MWSIMSTLPLCLEGPAQHNVQQPGLQFAAIQHQNPPTTLFLLLYDDEWKILPTGPVADVVIHASFQKFGLCRHVYNSRTRISTPPPAYASWLPLQYLQVKATIGLPIINNIPLHNKPTLPVDETLL